MERDAVAAAAALADIDAQQGAVRRRIEAEAWPPAWLGVVLGVLAASLVWRNIVLFTVVAALYLVSALPLIGTPSRAGVVPRFGRGSFAVVLVAVVFVAGTPMLAMAGPWWTALIAGAGAVVFVPVFARWRRAQARRDLPGPAVRTPSPLVRRFDAVAVRAATVPVVAVLMGGAVLAFLLGVPWTVLVYVPGMWLMMRRQSRIGAVRNRPRFFWVGFVVASVVIIGSPAITNLARGHGGWWLTAGYPAVVVVTVALAGWWQQRRLDGAAPQR